MTNSMIKNTGAKYSIVGCCLLIMSMAAFAQEGELNALRKQFTDYQQYNFQEKVYVHTAKTFYLAGEIIWFKIYEVDEYFNKPLPVSNVVYVEVINADNKPVLQASIEMNGGTGNGSFAIPSSIISGNYTLRAYSSWMKNFSPDFYFEQAIAIVNTLKGNAGTDQASLHSNASVQFFPEGGNLVYGLQSTVAFKATDEYGRAAACRGIIVNRKNDTVELFQSGRFGMGHFLFLPQKGEEYKAIITARDSTFNQSLPRIFDNGYVMSVNDTAGDKVKIKVQSGTLNINMGLYLIAHSRHLIKSVQFGKINEKGETEFYINKNALGDGVSAFTIFNFQKQPVCERIYFKKPGRRFFIQAKTDQQEYATRNKIEVTIKVADPANLPVQANMSLSVFRNDSLQPVPAEDIQTYLELTSELKGFIESPAYYFENSNAEADEAMNNLLLTQGWRRFRWEDVFKNQKPAFDYLPEFEGPVINAKITDKTPKKRICKT